MGDSTKDLLKGVKHPSAFMKSLLERSSKAAVQLSKPPAKRKSESAEESPVPIKKARFCGLGSKNVKEDKAGGSDTKPPKPQRPAAYERTNEKLKSIIKRSQSKEEKASTASKTTKRKSNAPASKGVTSKSEQVAQKSEPKKASSESKSNSPDPKGTKPIKDAKKKAPKNAKNEPKSSSSASDPKSPKNAHRDAPKSAENGPKSSSSDSKVKSSPSTQQPKDTTPESDANEPKSSSPDPKEDSPKTTVTPGRAKRGITGLMNNSEQCFANSVLQLIDVALDGIDLDAALGAPDDEQPFEEPEILPKDRLKRPRKGVKMSKLWKFRTAIHDRIKKSRKEGKLKHLSLRKHLRKLLGRMRRHGKDKEEHVSGMLFQQILARGKVSGSTIHEHLDGSSQQDAHEYFHAVMEGVISDETERDETERAVGAAILESAFDFTSDVKTICMDKGSCGFKGEPKTEHFNTLEVHVPHSKQPMQLEDVLIQSAWSKLDTPCEKCNGPTQRKSAIQAISNNFVVHINRTGADRVSKIKTPIELSKSLTIHGKKCFLSAVVRHEGDSLDYGHYTMFRKRSREYRTQPKTNALWYHVNDDEVKAVEAEDVLVDGDKSGECTLLLYKVAA